MTVNNLIKLDKRCQQTFHKERIYIANKYIKCYICSAYVMKKTVLKQLDCPKYLLGDQFKTPHPNAGKDTAPQKCIHHLWECEMVQQLWESFWQFL